MKYLTWIRRIGTPVTVLAALLVIPSVSHSEMTRYYSIEGFTAFLDGNPETTGLTEEGGIILASVTRDRLVQPEIGYSAAVAHGETIVVAHVDDGKVVAIDRAGKEKVLYESKDTLITSMLSHRGYLYVATGPTAKIYRISSSGKSKLFYESEAEHIWGMAVGPNGSILCVTGGPGHVLQIDTSGNGSILVETEQTHLRSIHFHKKYGLFVGGGELGILFHAPLKDLKALRTLYDSGQDEITGIVVSGDYVYAAGVSGADSLVSEQGNFPSPGQKRKPINVESQLAQISLDGTARILAGSNDEAIFGMVLDAAGNVLVSTGATGREDPRGRVYSIDPKRRLISLVYQSPSRRITHLLNLPRGAIAAIAAAGGRITHIAGGFAPSGEFISAPFDLGINSQFGAVDLLGEFPKGTTAFVSIRTGQSATPDKRWSPWSEEVPREEMKAPKVPNGRHAQLRVRLETKSKATPTVIRVRVAYLRTNLPPFVRHVSALEKGIALLPIIREEVRSKTISLGGKIDNPKKKKNGDRPKTPKARRIVRNGALTLRWIAEDPNDDVLRYGLDVRRTEGGEWRELDSELVYPFYTLSSSQLPDGQYRFRVRATDAFSNPVGHELMDQRESFSVLVDNTAPMVSPMNVSRSRGVTTISVSVEDSVGPLTSAVFSLDGAGFRHLSTDDGVLDGAEESFTMKFRDLESGTHTLTVRVIDSSKNEGVGETIFEIK